MKTGSRFALLFFVFLVIPSFVLAARIHPESYYTTIWCEDHNGTTWTRLPDGTIPDCINDKYAVEVEFADGWYESVAQSLHYAMLSGKKAGIVIIMEHTSTDAKYWNRLLALKKFYKLPITTWRIYP